MNDNVLYNIFGTLYDQGKKDLETLIDTGYIALKDIIKNEDPAGWEMKIPLKTIDRRELNVDRPCSIDDKKIEIINHVGWGGLPGVVHLYPDIHKQVLFNVSTISRRTIMAEDILAVIALDEEAEAVNAIVFTNEEIVWWNGVHGKITRVPYDDIVSVNFNSKCLLLRTQKEEYSIVCSAYDDDEEDIEEYQYPMFMYNCVSDILQYAK